MLSIVCKNIMQFFFQLKTWCPFSSTHKITRLNFCDFNREILVFIKLYIRIGLASLQTTHLASYVLVIQAYIKFSTAICDSYYTYVTGIRNSDPSAPRKTHSFNLIVLSEMRKYLPCEICYLICQLSSYLIIARELGLCSKCTKNFPLHGFIGSANKTVQCSVCQRICSNLRGNVEGIHEVLLWLDSSHCARASTLSRLHDHTHTQYLRQYPSGQLNSPSQTPVSDHKTHKRQTSIPPAEFEPTMPASERQQTHVLDRVAIGIGRYRGHYLCHNRKMMLFSTPKWLINHLVLVRSVRAFRFNTAGFVFWPTVCAPYGW